MLRLKALPRHFPNWHLLIEELSGRQITAMFLLSLFSSKQCALTKTSQRQKREVHKLVFVS